jgi:transcriptional regulator with XRE-family HTH domain
MSNKHAHNAGISSLRLQLGMTQQEFADSLGISRSLVGMAEIGVRSLPAATRPLLMGLHQLTGQLAPVETGYRRERRKGRSATAKRYNRVDKMARQRNMPLLQTAGTRQEDQSALPIDNSSTAKSYTAGINAILTRDECLQMIQLQSVQKQVLQQQLQYRVQERETAGVKGQELASLLTYMSAMVDIEDRHMISLKVPLSQKNAAIRKAKFQHKKLLLERQLMRFNTSALLLRELKINIAEKQLSELREMLEALEQRMAELP